MGNVEHALRRILDRNGNVIAAYSDSEEYALGKRIEVNSMWMPDNPPLETEGYFVLVIDLGKSLGKHVVKVEL